MDNHYHLLVQTGEDPLHKIIFRQNLFYSRYFNKTYNRSGHLYGDRYKAAVIQDERYILAVLRYIHWNPVRAGLCANPSEYPWSSDICYQRNRSGEIDIDFLLNILSRNREAAIIEYKKLMQVDDDVQYDSLKIIGDDQFVESFREDQDNIDRNEQGLEVKKMSLDNILKETGVSDVEFRLIKEGSRKRNLIPYKTEYINKAVKHGYSYKEIGENIKVSASAVGLLRLK